MMVSVIIPTYKPGDYIYECLKAVCNQSFSKDDYEIVIVVNGCKEPFVENISSYLKKTLECNYQILQTDIPGVSNARNFGMEKPLVNIWSLLMMMILSQITICLSFILCHLGIALGVLIPYHFMNLLLKLKKTFLLGLFYQMLGDHLIFSIIVNFYLHLCAK